MSHDKTNQSFEPTVVEEETQQPVYDVTETVDEFIVTAAIPGVDRTGVETVIDGDDLVISGKRSWQQPEEWKILHEEIPTANYRLALRLDHRVNRESLKAHLANGILTVTLPKAEEIKPHRIDIQG